MAQDVSAQYLYYSLLSGALTEGSAKTTSTHKKSEAADSGKPKEQKAEQKQKQKQKQKQQPKKAAAEESSDKGTLGLTVKKLDDLSEWYTQVITKAEMIDYYDISGLYIVRPWAYAIWEQIQAFFDTEIKKIGVRNAYFPLLVSERALTAEKEHIEGFAPEVAWVTKAGDSILAEPIAVRPTSETIMYPAYARWIRSHRDLPLQLNQWCSVVRWEFKHPVPFLRTREFLWQEGHSVFPDEASAGKEVRQILDLYAKVYEQLLAVPVVQGRKSEREKFAGGHYTTTCEAFIASNGRGIQGATSHCLGTNFSKMFHIEFEDHAGHKQYAWQNSWGITTRTLGVMVMVHGDDRGLVLPPRIAPIQVVVVPIFYKGKDNAALLAKSVEVAEKLRSSAGLRVHVDERDIYSPGWKFNHWELKGIPLRVEVGPKDLLAEQVTIVRRDTLEKEQVPLAEVVARTTVLIEDIQSSMLRKARAERDAHLVPITKWNEFVPTLNERNVVLAPWCTNGPCEDQIKAKSQKEAQAAAAAALEGGFQLTAAAKSLCIPFNQKELPPGAVCFSCGEKATCWAMFGRSY